MGCIRVRDLHGCDASSGRLQICIFIALAPLPIEFLEGRRGACLYVPLAAWAVFGSVIFMDVTHLAAVFRSAYSSHLLHCRSSSWKVDGAPVSTYLWPHGLYSGP